MGSTIKSRATRSKSTSTTCAASSVRVSSPTSRDAATASKTAASGERPWSLRRRMAVAAASAACVVFLLLGLLVYRSVAASTAVQFDELLQQLSFALVLLTALIGLVTERAFRPVRRIAANLAERSDEDLSPVNTAEMPVETHALGVALNGLLARQAEILARERRFTADAAHELRTPLAALRVQAQVAARATTAAETRSALDKLRANIDRTTHLVSQLLSLARLEPGSALIPGQTTETQRVVALLLEDLAPMARDRQVEISLAGCEQQLPGLPEVLYPLLRNLLENSIRNVSARGRVALEVAPGDQCAVLTISDDGPGIPRAERTRAFERFYRIPGSAKGGSGLGLSIVGRIVELLGGEIELAAPAAGSGLVVTVTLPVSAQPQTRSAA